MGQLAPQRKPRLGRESASRALFRWSGTITSSIGRVAGKSPSLDEGKILVVQLGDIGDLVLTSPFLRELGKAAGARDQELVLVVKPTVYPLAERCPYASRVLAFDTKRTRFAGTLSGLARARRFAKSELGSGFTAAWNPRFDIDELGASYLMLYSGAATRVGYSEHVSASKELRNHGYDRLLSRTVMPDPSASRHEADRLLGLLEVAGVQVSARDLELWLEPEDEAATPKILDAAGTGARVALGIGAGHPKRCWPAERFARVAEHLHRESEAIAVLVGGPTERAMADEISVACRAPLIDAVGRLPLRETAALIRECALYIGNDSGLLHISAAAGLPVLEISCHPIGGDPEHPNSPERFGPYGVPSVVLRPAHPVSPGCATGCEAPSPHCIEGVAVGDVLEGIATLLPDAERISP